MTQNAADAAEHRAVSSDPRRPAGLFGSAFSIFIALLWGGLPVSIKSSLKYGEPLQIGWMRFALGGLITLAYMVARRETFSPQAVRDQTHPDSESAVLSSTRVYECRPRPDHRRPRYGSRSHDANLGRNHRPTAHTFGEAESLADSRNSAVLRRRASRRRRRRRGFHGGGNAAGRHTQPHLRHSARIQDSPHLQLCAERIRIQADDGSAGHRHSPVSCRQLRTRKTSVHSGIRILDRPSPTRA